ncbi:MAG: histidine phosphatase family protein [Gemmatimonadota bacterium]
MHLLLIRHADAGDADPSLWPDDSLRPLTEKGLRRHLKVARRISRQKRTPALLLSSPWLRAWQTAQLTAEHTGGPAPVACPALAAAPSLRALAAALGRRPHDAIVALVGHEPWLGELGSLLLTGDARRLTILFPKSGVLGVEVGSLDAGGGALEFFWRPKGE